MMVALRDSLKVMVSWLFSVEYVAEDRTGGVVSPVTEMGNDEDREYW